MTAESAPLPTGGARTARREPAIPSQVVAMLLFVYAELMLFAGLISAHAITRASAPMGIWPPLGQPRLPVASTAFNTALLLLSGVTLLLGVLAFGRSKGAGGRLATVATVILGTAFVVLQGREWVALLREGLTLRSSNHGAFFYLIVGTHALHAVAALAALAWVVRRMHAGTLTPGQLHAAALFWYFVVGMWPFLYWRVYL